MQQFVVSLLVRMALGGTIIIGVNVLIKAVIIAQPTELDYCRARMSSRMPLSSASKSSHRIIRRFVPRAEPVRTTPRLAKKFYRTHPKFYRTDPKFYRGKIFAQNHGI